jgi:hypothetical protein
MKVPLYAFGSVTQQITGAARAHHPAAREFQLHEP